jgi:KDO2-lipid IV(A) lauroyltransferase
VEEKEAFIKKKKDHSVSRGFVFWAINLIPLKARIWFLERLGELAYMLDGRHRRIAHRNLAIAFVDKDLKERAKIARSAFRNLGRVLAEFSFIPRLNGENTGRYIAMEGLDNFHRAHAKRKGVLFLTAHFGNWEWMAATFPLMTRQPCHVVVRPLDNGFLDGLVDKLRTSTGNHTIPKRKSMGRILRLLREGEVVGILLDQNMAWHEGVFVNFFGELACTNMGMALLALKTGAAVLPVFNVRQPDGSYRVIIEQELPLIRTGNRDLEIEKNTEVFTRVIERYVNDYPDHWLWLHQRWKTRPWQSKQYRNSKS